MKIIRKTIENFVYPCSINLFFLLDKKGKLSHKLLTLWAKKMSFFGITKFCLQDNSIEQNFLLSNAAGWNKDGKIGNDFFEFLGFNRIVLGSVTSKAYEGNQISINIKRLLFEKSMLNWLGLPNAGAAVLAKKLAKWKLKLPLTINIAALPHSNNPCLSVLESIKILKNFGDRWEINISCPNTKEQNSWRIIREIVEKTSQNKYAKELFFKISPQWQPLDLKRFLQICSQYEVTGFVAGNGSLKHAYQPHPHWKGSLSGELLFNQSYQLVKNLWQEIQKKYKNKNWKIIACGGISQHKQLLKYQKLFGILEFQVYTAFIYQGPKLVRNLQNGN